MLPLRVTLKKYPRESYRHATEPSEEAPHAACLRCHYQPVLAHIYHEAVQEIWIGLWRVEAIYGSYCPVVPGFLHGTDCNFSNVFGLPNRIGEGGYCMPQLLLQHHTARAYLVLYLSQIS